MLRCKLILSLLISAFILLPAAHAQFVQQGSKLVSADVTCQGAAVAVSADGNTAIVGTNCFDGAAVIYVRANGAWSRQGPRLVGRDGSMNAFQGSSVAMSADGNTVIIGGPNDASGAGAAWVFTRTNGVWSQQGPKLVGSGANGNAGQGFSVAISVDGSTAIVGGPFDNHETGATWVFTQTNGVWNQQGPKLAANDAAANDAAGNSRQGYSVALSADGSTAIVGGPGDGSSGAAWVYVRANQAWNQQGGKLVGIGTGQGFPAQGFSVAVSADGNTALVGAPFDNISTGAVWVFTRNASVWSPQGRIIGNGGVGIANFGRSVALSANGDTTIIGGNMDNSGVGAAWPFVRRNGLWFQQGARLVGTGFVGTQTHQGTSVAISGDGNTALVGGNGDNDSAGAVWPFVHTNMYFQFSAVATTTAGVPFNFAVTALNSDNSTVIGYNGTIHFTSTDPLAVLPADSIVVNGVGNFTATLGTTILAQTITATDTANPLFAGTSEPIQVLPGATTRFRLTVPPQATAGVPIFLNVVPIDQLGNPLPPYPGRVRFTSSDPTAVLPAESTGTSFPFQAILNAAGNQTITVTDAANPSITGTSNAIAVTANASGNLARGKAATQSSTLPGYAYGGPAAAVDGVTDGNFFNGSVTHTNSEANPWWQVDLGNSSLVTSIVISNRTDCCASRLNDYWVFLSDTPFGPADTPATLQNRPGTWSIHQASTPNPSTTIPTGNIFGRYVRVQLAGVNYLSLAEVQVLSNPALTWNVAAGKPAAQSSTYPGYPANANLAVDGSTDGNFFDGSVTHTDLDTEPWWQVDLGNSNSPVLSVFIHNRTDCCGSRLGDYYLFVSNQPFGPTDTIASLLGRQGTTSIHQTAAPNPSTAIPVGIIGRYLRVQVPGRNYLSLAEVQVVAAQIIGGEANPGVDGASSVTTSGHR